MPLPKIIPAERRLANEKARLLAPVERAGMAEGARLAFRAATATLRAWRAGQDPATALTAELRKAIPSVTDAMVGAHLSGVLWMRQRTGKHLALSLARRGQDAQADAVDALRKRLDLTPDEIDRIVGMYSSEAAKVIHELSDHGSEKLNAALQDITAQGMHVREGMARMREALDSAGIFGTSDTPAFLVETLYRTQIQMAYGTAQWQSAQDPAIQEILWGYRYITVKDDRVRLEHAALEGTTAPKDDPIWDEIMPLNGWGCRCSVIELFSEVPAAYPPDEVEMEGRMIRPGADEGFRVNFGKVLGGGNSPVPALGPS